MWTGCRVSGTCNPQDSHAPHVSGAHARVAKGIQSAQRRGAGTCTGEAGILLRLIIHQLLKLESQHKLKRLVSFLELLEELRQANTQALSKFVYAKSLSTNEGERLQLVFEFVFKNFQKPISLEKIAKMAFMTPNAFCRFFKQRTNKTFFQFLIELRVAHACQLLNQNKELNINIVADLSGFNSISNFNKKFKKIKGVTPTQYQQSLVL